MLELTVVFVAVAYVFHLICRARREGWNNYVNHALDTWPRPGDGHAPGDGAIKANLIREGENSIIAWWVAQLLGTFITVALVNHYFLG